MPDVDITAAKRELLADRKPLGLIFNGTRYEFPGVMPAAVEIAQMQADRITRDLPDDAPQPAGLQNQMLEAVYGEAYEELSQTVGATDLMVGLGVLMQYWLAAWQDPTLPQRLLSQAQQKLAGPDEATWSKSFSSTGAPSNPTSNGSTGSTSHKHSGGNGSVGGASSRSTRGSQARP